MPKMYIRSVFIVLGYLCCFGNGMIEHIQTPGGMLDCFSRYAEKTTVVDTVGESIASFCFGQYMWKASREHGIPGFNITREAYTWVQGLMTQPQRVHKRQAIVPNLRVRKEYRRLTDMERVNFHRAIQMLKADTSVAPNMYDALSAIHQGMMTTSAHGGPNFLGFHRVYVLMFENALRQKIPSVTVPYWDSSLDEAMPNPSQSILFTDHFMGNGLGVVNSGPFARWMTLSGPLIRNVGQSGQLFRKPDLARIMSSMRLAQITEPNAAVNSSLEFLHNQVHLWIDGQMGSLDTAAHDPIFWLHHSFVDYVWEQFRHNQRRFGVNPTTDYPTFINNSMHSAMYPMGLSGMRNRDGLSDRFTSTIYTYEPSPTCSAQFKDCGSPYLTCVIRHFQHVCMSVDWTMPVRAAVIQNQVIRTRQMQAQSQAVARMNMINIARTQQQQSQMAAAASQRLAATQVMSAMSNQPMMTLHTQNPMDAHAILSQRLLTEMQQHQTTHKEMENGVLDDAAESHHVQRRKAYSRRRRYLMNRLEKMINHAVDPRGNAFESGAMNINSNLQMTMIPNMPTQEPPIPLQNASNVPILPQVTQGQCPSTPVSQGFQNTFNINGRSDINQWVYIPVKVIYQRPPTYTNYKSYPIINGEMEAEDIYSAQSNMAMKNALRMGKPASYSHCNQYETGAGKVYITSRGLNYMGTYKEYAVVDQRLSISIATAYVAVKSPQFGASEVFLNAYDSCGRVCVPYCKLAGAPGFQRCSGSFRVTSSLPAMYGMNYGDAVTHLWQFHGNGLCPTIAEANIYIKFHCNFMEAWPFGVRPGTVPLGGNSSATAGAGAASDEFEAPEEPAAAGGQSATNTGQGQHMACDVGGGCLVTGGCNRCTNGKTYQCIGACSVYTSCQNGGHQLQYCPNNTIYDSQSGSCIPGSCHMTSQNSWWMVRRWK